jgi:hypothetical protein
VLELDFYVAATVVIVIPSADCINAVVELVDVLAPATGNFIKVLIDQYDWFTEDFFHWLLPR